MATLLKAFDLFKETDTKGIKLVVAGNRVWWQDELAETYDNMQFQQDVIFLGRVSQDDLFNLLGASLAMIYPSLFEGFGIPIVEAFYAEVPVITSNCTSMPEVAGDAAILVDPSDVNSLADSMTRLATDVPFRDMLISKGREQRLRFTWTKTAERLWESMMNSIEQGGC